MPRALTTSWVRRGLALVAIVLVCAGGYWVGSAPRRHSDAEPALSVPLQYLSFGEVWEDPEFVWSLPIENHSSAPIEIADFQSSCPYLIIAPRQLTIPPEATASVRLTIDLTGLMTGGCGGGPAGSVSTEQDGAVRDYSLQLVPIRADGNYHQGWVIQGRVRSVFTLSARRIDFGDSFVEGQEFKPATVALQAHIQLAKLSADCKPALANVKVAGGDQHYLLHIQPEQSLPPGDFRFDVHVAAKTNNGDSVRGRVRVAGRVLSNTYCLPEAVLFGAREVGETLEETVEIRSYDGHSFEILAVESNHEQLSVRQVYQGKHVRRFRLSQKVSHVGDSIGNVEFVIRTTNGRESKISLPVRYHGMPVN